MIGVRCVRKSVRALLISVVMLGALSPLSSANTFPKPGSAPGSQPGDDGTAFSGIAQAPGADLFTGAATTRIKIEVPPGRVNMTPELALTYSSAGGRSPYGHGWSLTIGRISRSTKFGVPTGDNDVDTFVLELPGAAGELVRVAGTQKQFRPRVESAYLKIGFDEANNYWVVIDKTGTKFTFGKDNVNSRAGWNVNDSNGTFAWMLETVEDTFGNVIRYEYVAAAPGEASPPGLPQRVWYGGTSDGVIPNLFKVEMVWDTSAVATGPVTFAEGFKRYLQGRRLDRIYTFAPTDTTPASQAARVYTFIHDYPAGNYGVLQLAQVHVQAQPLAVSVPASSFEYAPLVQLGFPRGADRSNYAEKMDEIDNGVLRSGGASAGFDIFDLNGDAIVDYVKPSDTGGEVRMGNGHGFEPASSWPFPAGFTHVREENGSGEMLEAIFDLTGDGLPDAIRTPGPVGLLCQLSPPPGCTTFAWCVYRHTGTGFRLNAEPWCAPAPHVRNVDSDADLTQDTIDMNGDGRPDFVDIGDWDGTGRWKVYLNNGVDGFDTTPLPWPSPREYLSKTTTPWGSQPVVTEYGLVDMNGDGLLDFVDTEKDALEPDGYTARWKVYLNTGFGFEADEGGALVATEWRIDGSNATWLTEYYNKTFSDNGVQPYTSTSTELFDVTGDGLPDLVRPYGLNDASLGVPTGSCPGGEPVCIAGSPTPPACCYVNIVFVNTGTSFAAPITVPSWDFTGGVIGARALRLQGSDGQPHAWPNKTPREFDMFDFDGDGLLDLIERVKPGTQEEWHLYRNPASPYQEGSDTDPAVRTRPGSLVRVMNGLGSDTEIQYAPASLVGDTFCAANPDPEDLDGKSGRCNPYPNWVVTAVSVNDTIDPSTSPLVTHYGYSDALYDGDERENRGFGLAWEVAPTGVTIAHYFHQDLACSGRGEESRVYGSAGTGCFEFVLPDETDQCSPLYGHDKLMSTTVNDWECAEAILGMESEPPTPVLLRSTTTTPYRRPSGQAPVVATTPSGESLPKSLAKTVTYDYDALGNEISRLSYSDSADWIGTYTEYVAKVEVYSGGLPSRYVASRPARIYSRYEESPSTVFQEKSFGYNSEFAVTQISDCMQWAAGTCVAKTTITKSGNNKYGMPDRSVGPGSATTSYTYDGYRLVPLVTTHPDKLKTTVNVYDYRIAKATQETGKDGQLIYSTYDGLGRPRDMWGPGFTSGSPEIRLTYVNPDPVAGTYGRVRRDEVGSTPAVTFFDGFARAVAVKRQVDVLGGDLNFATATRVEGLKIYDSAGRVVYGALPLDVTSSDPNIESLTTTISSPPTVAFTEMEYEDATGTLERLYLPGPAPGTGRASEGRDTTVPGVSATEDPEGLVSLEYTDGFGRVIRRDQCAIKPDLASGATCTGANLLSRDLFEYDGMDRVTSQRRYILGASVSNPASYVRVEEATYDGLGNVVYRIDANSNEWSNVYNSSTGLLVLTTTPRGDQITRKYDKANRISVEKVLSSVDTAPNTQTKYRYLKARKTAVFGAGEIEKISFKSVNGGVRHTRVFTYDARGRVDTESIQIEGEHGDKTAYTFEYEYDEADRVIETTYPARDSNGNLVNDLIRTEYTGDGKVAAVYKVLPGGELVYALSGYDYLGHRIGLYYGNNRADLAKYAATAQNSYLECLRTTSATVSPSAACQQSGSDQRAVRYADRDLNGRIERIDDLLNGSSPSSPAYSNYHNVAYDSLGRLSSVAYSANATDSFAYDELGRLETRGATSFQYTSPITPFAPTSIGSSSLQYDENGNRTQKGNAGYSYTAAGNLAEAKSGGAIVQHNAYGPDGARVARYDFDSGEVVHYYDGRFEVQGNTIVRHFYIGDKRVASDRISAPTGLTLGSAVLRTRNGGSANGGASGWGTQQFVEATRFVPVVVLLLGLGLAATCPAGRSRVAAMTAAIYVGSIIPVPFGQHAGLLRGLSPQDAQAQVLVNTTVYYHTDHLGSPQVITDQSGSVVEHIRYDVFGKVRGIFTQSGGSKSETSTSLGYTGHEPDESTDLVYFGVRHLDPTDGHFLSVDPAGQYVSPYVHGAYDPLNGRDPDGAFFGPVALAFSAVASFQFATHLISALITASTVDAAVMAIGTAVSGYVTSQVMGGITQGLNEFAASLSNPVAKTLTQAVAVGPSLAYNATSKNVAGVASDVGGLALGALTTGAEDQSGLSRGGASDESGSEQGSNHASNAVEDNSRLPGSVIEALKPYFPNFDLGSLRIRAGIPWYVTGDPDAYTNKADIYFADGAYDPTTASGIALIGHEALHSQQYQTLGALRFRTRYLREYIGGRLRGMAHGEAYANISFEKEAFMLQRRIEFDLRRAGYTR